MNINKYKICVNEWVRYFIYGWIKYIKMTKIKKVICSLREIKFYMMKNDNEDRIIKIKTWNGWKTGNLWRNINVRVIKW